MPDKAGIFTKCKPVSELNNSLVSEDSSVSFNRTEIKMTPSIVEETLPTHLCDMSQGQQLDKMERSEKEHQTPYWPLTKKSFFDRKQTSSGGQLSGSGSSAPVLDLNFVHDSSSSGLLKGLRDSSEDSPKVGSE